MYLVNRQPLITYHEKNSLFANGCRLPWVSGISPSYTINIYRTSVLPRLTFGLEAVVLKEKHIQSLESYHWTTLRELQSLPKRTTKCAIYLLAGTLPLEGLLDIQIASLLHMAGGQRNTVLFVICMYQLNIKNTKSTSWFRL